MISIGALIERLFGIGTYGKLIQRAYPAEYFVVRWRDREFNGGRVRAIAVTDDLGGSRFASAMHAASVRLEERYPFGSYDIRQVLADPGNVSETYKASELASVKW